MPPRPSSSRISSSEKYPAISASEGAAATFCFSPSEISVSQPVGASVGLDRFRLIKQRGHRPFAFSAFRPAPQRGHVRFSATNSFSHPLNQENRQKVTRHLSGFWLQPAKTPSR